MYDGPERRRADDARLDRIEKKIDQLSDAMISLARAEEKLIAIEKNNHANYERMNRFSQKLDSIEERVQDNTKTIQIISRLFWIGVTTITAVLVSQHFPF